MKKTIIRLITAALVLLWAGCQSPINPEKIGSLSVTINDGVSRSILPEISMNPASYELEGTGPNDASFTETVGSGSSATITDLAFGQWSVTATAFNSDGTAIGAGNGTVTVLSNSTVSLNITVVPFEGEGSLELDVIWPGAQIQTAQIESTLTPSSGESRDLAFTVNGEAGNASFSADDVASGYHTLILKLLDNGHLAIGAVEVVRIVADQSTSGILEFENVNQATGNIEVGITPEMNDPLDVSISGAELTKPENQSLDLSASVSNYEGNVTYVWYVNATAVATGAAFTLDNSWAQGYYRVDVTAFSADGKRAGSATATIQVVESVTGEDNYISPNIGTLVYVPAGNFQRDGTPSNISIITQPYRMSQHQITQAQFEAVMGTNPSYFASGDDAPNRPVERVNWYHAIAFANKLSLAEGLTPVYSVSGVNWNTLTFGQIPTALNDPLLVDWNAATANWDANGYRLPTEMEWMWAAMGADQDSRPGAIDGEGVNRTGYSKPFAGSNGSNTIDAYAWYSNNSGNTTHPVGTKLPNELGLFDMSGNVWDWNWDWYAAYPTGTLTDHKGAASGTFRVLRGGSWLYNASYCTVAIRNHNIPYGQSGYNDGFRLVRP